jgi:hypothetical protein
MAYEVLPNVSLLEAIAYASPLVIGVLGTGYCLLFKNPRDLQKSIAREIAEEQAVGKNIQV